MTDVIIKKSKIQGKGVFAAKDVKKGEIVIDWSTCSISLTQSEVDQLPSNKKKYVSYAKNGKYVLFSSPGKYVNHSCDSNTKAINECDVAIRDIKKGEEITADYIAEKVPNLNTECKCRAKNCRKWLKTDNQV